MISRDLDLPRRALAIGAHPDDIEFGCGGTLAKWSSAGVRVELLILTDGSKGTWDPDADPRALAEIRVREQEASAAILGAATTHRLGAVDGELAETNAARAEICRVVRTVRPDVVIGHDPWKRYRLHPDHRHAGFLTIDALIAARDPHFFPDQGLETHRPQTLLLFEAEEADHVEGVDDTIGTKIDALLAHASQWQSTFGIDPTNDMDSATQAFRDRIRVAAQEHGAMGDVTLGEAFKRIEEL